MPNAEMNTSSKPRRKTGNLHRGRVSIPGARYFVTVCAVRPTQRLTERETAVRLLADLASVCSGPDGALLCATVMPDHVHALLTLGNRLALGQLLGKYKTLTREYLRRKGLHWQRDFFDHRLRPEDLASPFARYIFLNPYREHLIPRRSLWPWWRDPQIVEFDFTTTLEDGRYPPIEWLESELAALGIRPEEVGLH